MEKRSIIPWVAIGLGVVFLIALAVFNSKNGPNAADNTKPWNAAMVVGSPDAPNRIIEYGDYFCEFCTKFNEQTVSEAFINDYLKPGVANVETRPITVLAGPFSPNSEQGAEAAFCAADQSKFEAYSNDIIPRIKNDFFDKGVGVKSFKGELLSSPQPIDKLSQSYFIESAEAARLDVDEFEACMKDGRHLAEIERNTQKAINSGVRGLPHIQVNNYVTSGFGGGWENFKLMLKAGGVKTD